MENWRCLLACVLVGFLLPLESNAQGVDVGVSGVGLVSFQPPNDAFGGPYLDVNIGTARAGFGVGINLIASSGFVVGAEFTRADFNGYAAGRLISGSGSDQGRLRRARLNDSLVAGLAGYAITSGRTRVLFLGGAGAALHPVRLDEEPGSFDPRMMFTGGADIMQLFGSRAAFLMGGRYAFVDRNTILIGGHVFRFAAGIRIRMG
jgi:hypothetical protein